MCALYSCLFAVSDAGALRLILQNFAEVKEELRTMRASLQEVVRRQRGTDAVRSGQLPNGVNLPLKQLQDVQALETQLRCSDTYTQLVCFELCFTSLTL